MKVGAISDTHGYFDIKLYDVFNGVSHIFHSGDIGEISIIERLQEIAPVTAVRGNNDAGIFLPYIKCVQLGKFKFLITHKFGSGKYDLIVREKIFIENPNVVIFGHTHFFVNYYEEGRLFLNPGYSGHPNGIWERTVAIINCDGDQPLAKIIQL